MIKRLLAIVLLIAGTKLILTRPFAQTPRLLIPSAFDIGRSVLGVFPVFDNSPPLQRWALAL